MLVLVLLTRSMDGRQSLEQKSHFLMGECLLLRIGLVVITQTAWIFTLIVRVSVGSGGEDG